MKRGDVILYKDRFFLVTKTSKTRALISLIKADGLVSKLSQAIDKKVAHSVIKGAKKSIKIDLPYDSVGSYKYENMVKDAKRCIYNILTGKEVERNKAYLTHLVMRSCMIPQKGGIYLDIGYFCKRIGLKKPKKLYELLANHIMQDINERSSYIEALSDRGLDKVISNYMTYWKSWYGFDKTLDKALKTDLKMHMGEFRNRLSEKV